MKYYGIDSYDLGPMYHSGILGMRWGKRRYQNKDGSLTPLGKQHYGVGTKTPPQGYKHPAHPDKKWKDMSTQDLRAEKERFDAEKNYIESYMGLRNAEAKYSEASQSKFKKAMKSVGKQAMKDLGKDILKPMAMHYIKKSINTMAGEKIFDVGKKENKVTNVLKNASNKKSVNNNQGQKKANCKN